MENLISKPVKKEHAEDCDLRNLGDCTCGEPIRNQAIDECIAYTNKLLEPLEEAIANMNRHGVDYKKSIFDRYIDLEKAVKSVIRKHKGEKT